MLLKTFDIKYDSIVVTRESEYYFIVEFLFGGKVMYTLDGVALSNGQQLNINGLNGTIKCGIYV